MATLPTFAKTWQFNVNNRVLTSELSGATGQNVHGQMIVLAIKNSLKGFANSPWTVQFSSNCGNNGAGSAASGTAGTAGDLVDRWTIGNTASGANSTNDLNFAAAWSRHSWMVLRQTGILSNYEL